ncbi:isochorismatase family protein, partial [Pseudomonas sp. OA3]|nr:isochorismatase family protein [Pseudomonas sp. OA3]
KHYINSFRETELKAVLDRHAIDAVVVVGNMSHMCVDGITRAAVDFGYDTTVLHDACATLDLQFNGVKVPAEHVHAAFMAALSFGYAPVISTAEYLAQG